MKQLSSVKAFEGQQIQISHHSDLLNCDMQASIFLPPAAEHQAVPTLYWLSGLTCNDLNFVTKAGGQKIASELGVAIVCPDTSPRGEGVPDDSEGAWDFGLGAGFYVNATQEPWKKNYQMCDYVSMELPKLIESQFNIDAQLKSIFGHSMGGHGALTIGLKNQDSYKSVSAFSPIVAPMQCAWGVKAFENYLGNDRDQWKDYDACELLECLGESLPTLIDQGTADGFLEEQLMTDLYVKAAGDAKGDIRVRYQQGYDHSYFFIATFIEEHIRFHSGHLQASESEC